MQKVNDIPFNLVKIKRRAMGFWLTLTGVVLLALCLFLLEQIAAAKVIVLAGTILSIATWMSAMMSICPSCKASFHEGYVPRAWPQFGCAKCHLSLK